MAGEPMAEVDFRRVLGRRLTITGSTLRPQTAVEKARIAAALRVDVWPLLERGRLRPIVDSVLLLRDAAEAHRRMEASHHVGKILLRTGENRRD
jgi:NADPH:quinone reductase-like Zn-dependent oxidoreductase